MMTLTARGLFAGVAVAVIVASGASGVPEPRLKPSPQHHSDLLSSADFATLRDGLDAADRGSWASVRASAQLIRDPVAAQILRWRAATSDPNVSFETLETASREFREWPRADDIRAEMESKIDSAGLSAAEIVTRFETDPPQTGEGHLALAEAYLTLGRETEGEAALREAWRNYVLPLRVQSDVLSRYRSRLTTEDHIARVDMLLWHDQRTAAGRLFSELPSGERALANARSVLAARGRGVDSAVAAVPAELVEHPGLLYERARWRRKARRTTDALPLVLQISGEFGPYDGPASVWYERRVHISRAIDDADFATAYQLAANHGMDPERYSADYADAEWYAGWFALQRLSDPDTAARHFARLTDAVSTPISKARGLYWQGRAAEAAGDATAAESFYAQAAEHSTAYYGQLAATRLVGGAAQTLPTAITPTQADELAFYANPLARATAILADLDELRLYREFSYHLDDQLSRPADLVLLAEIARDYGQNGVGVRAGKAGLAQGIVSTGAAYPVMELPPTPVMSAPEAPLSLALARQESEFYPRAVSPVGARGLMQMMPATARSTARNVGATYRENWLTDDPDYNLRLGQAHLSELLEEFDGSYVLAAAAYNAGASRARRWIRENGDPRGQVDPIDWVESIPFSETRNYVQRVMENTVVYRARLGDGEIEPTLDNDLSRGGPGN